jgi:hypothetical protein
MKIRSTAAPDPDAGTIHLYTEIEHIFGNVRREMAVEIMRTRENAVQQALIDLGWSPPTTRSMPHASEWLANHSNPVKALQDEWAGDPDARGYREALEQLATTLQQQLNEARDRARQAEAQEEGRRREVPAFTKHSTSPPFRAGDTVQHGPSGEAWILAVDEENGRVQPCGWPESMAEAKDCQLVEPATDQERIDMLNTWAAKGKGGDHERDSRTRAARRQLEAGQ